jgi:hypothetical protein
MERYRASRFDYQSDTGFTFTGVDTVLDTLNRESRQNALLPFKDMLANIADAANFFCDKFTREQLEVHGVTTEEIENLEIINRHVAKGREHLHTLLSQYNTCMLTIADTERRIRRMQEEIEIIKDKLSSLAIAHECISESSSTFVKELEAKQDTILEGLKTELALANIEKDKLCVMIKSLAVTYGIIKNAPFTHTCPICITNEVDIYFDPCGHTVCKSCSKSQYCHMCRTKIITVKSLFYS